jgi:hypothetical protein
MREKVEDGRPAPTLFRGSLSEFISWRWQRVLGANQSGGL